MRVQFRVPELRPDEWADAASGNPTMSRSEALEYVRWHMKANKMKIEDYRLYNEYTNDLIYPVNGSFRKTRVEQSKVVYQ